MMLGTANQHWWELHVRAARGERLSPEERAVYDAARRELEDSESLELLETAKRARDELRDLEIERSRLEQRRQELDAEIAAAESALGPQARQLLGARE